MALITWDDKKYSVSIPSIDIQHKKLVDLINKLHNGMMTGTAKSLIKEIIIELVDYTKTHFKYEEELLIKCGYDEFGQHKRIHESFIDRIVDFQGQYLKGEILLSIDIINFLRDWLMNHIAGSDKKYSETMISKGIK